MRKIFFANWKMYLSDDEAVALARAYDEGALSASVDVAVAPGFTALEPVARALAASKVALAAQDAFWKDEGAYTGEVAPKQLAALGVKYVIVGHSERRAMGETDEVVARKAAAVAADGMTPVACVGELKEEREAGRQEEIVRAQLAAVRAALPPAAPLVVAYEPRWAIGTGTPCEPSDVAKMHAAIRSIVGADVPVLYGGSVAPENFKSYLDLQDVDGLLVGGASARLDDVRAFFEAFSS
ncbi:MAG TPA: triose-phosphate isomerase [Patescibacteria group bacterium]|nr:triose-phosphate isomerase [Patescibacteria group bacterium]